MNGYIGKQVSDTVVTYQLILCCTDLVHLHSYHRQSEVNFSWQLSYLFITMEQEQLDALYGMDAYLFQEISRCCCECCCLAATRIPPRIRSR